MLTNDEKFKNFTGEDDLETKCGDYENMSIDDIGEFKILGDGKTQIRLMDILVKPVVYVSINAADNLKGLMKFIRHIIKTQAGIKDKEVEAKILNALSDDRTNMFSKPITFIQQLIKSQKK
tara:strand:- start:1864 stop:2226 length:363 start_codon:yes stop_codon:yes gene_type:complete